MTGRFQAPKGTRDLLPPETAIWAEVEAIARRVFGLYDYREIRTPIFEDTELFVRGVGESSDIVGKEMYSFADKSGRNLTLRPESTAPVCRAYIEHGLQSSPHPVRLFYIGPHFRYERPQKGRYRQFHQIGAEVLGGAGAESDTEVIQLLVMFLRELGLDEVTVLVNTVGDTFSRDRFRAALVSYLEPLSDQLTEDSLRRLRTNPLRILDTKNPVEIALLAGAPPLESHLTEISRSRRDTVEHNLKALGISFVREPRLVRGLDYYTDTVFEIVAPSLGAQNAICGGGAYEGLMEELGGRSIRGTGFAIGQDRLMEVIAAPLRERVEQRMKPVLVANIARQDPEAIVVSQEGYHAAFRAADRLRQAGIPAVFLGTERSPKHVFKVAGNRTSAWAILIGEAEVSAGTVSLRDLSSRKQIELTLDGAIEHLRASIVGTRQE